MSNESANDYTSKVPRFTFSQTLAEQRSELENNELMKRFEVSRRSLAGDLHRPVFHYVNPEGTLNDPNGLCFWQDRWHLFYQGYPPEDTRQHWGHAVSDDLIHWKDLPYAIYPNPERCCFSGATFVEDSRVIAMYHGTEVGNMVAVSSDPLLLNWEKVTGAAVIPFLKPDGTPQPHRVFDPCIWKKDGYYFSLSAGQRPDGPGGTYIRSNALFRSTDLETWEYMHPFVEDDLYSFVGDDGACPYFWPIGDRHILLYFSHMSGGKYLLGDYDTDRDKLLVTGGGRFNFGASTPSGVHAPSATPDGSGGVVVLFNMNPGKRTEGWNQIMSLPRLLTIDSDTSDNPLKVKPVDAVNTLRREHMAVGSVTLEANKELIVDKISGNAIELHGVFEPGSGQILELDVLRSPDGSEKTRILFYRERGFGHHEHGRRNNRARARDSLISIDTSMSSLGTDISSRAPETAPVCLQADEALDLRVFIDRSIVEVFANGRQCLGVRVYPDRADSIGVSLVSRGGGTTVSCLEAWQMENIYS